MGESVVGRPKLVPSCWFSLKPQSVYPQDRTHPNGAPKKRHGSPIMILARLHRRSARGLKR